MIVCHCEAVNDRTIRRALKKGSVSVEDVMHACGAGTQCGGCLDTLRALIPQDAGTPVAVG